MTAPTTDSSIRIGISHDCGDEALTMTVFNGSEHFLHRISLVRARALSLELIRQAYRAELNNRQNDISGANEVFSFQSRSPGRHDR